VFVITSIKPQKRRQRFNIYLDGKFAFAVSGETLLKSGLAVNQKLFEKDIKKLKYKDAKSKLYDKTLRFLSYRPRSKKEIRDYLKKKRAEPKIIEKIIKKLKKQNLIDDRVFADWWLEQRSRFRPKGRRALWSELFKKGISKEIIEEVLFSEKEELCLAKKAGLKKLKAYQNLEPYQWQQKMIGFLARRGFSWETIKNVLEEIKEKR
jgi:regulatory protein